MTRVIFPVAGALLMAALMFAAPADAQQEGRVLSAERTAGLVGEQADGYLGLVPGAQVSAALRGRVNQINIQRRSAYTRRAEAANVSINEIAAAVACEVFQERILVGDRYRNEGGQWRQRTASSPVEVPAFCAD